MASYPRSQHSSVTLSVLSRRQLTLCTLVLGSTLLGAVACVPPQPPTPPAPPAIVVASQASAQDNTRARLVNLHDRLELLLEEAMRFWLRHGRDESNGGFHGNLNRFGEPGEPSHRGLVQQTRHLWSLSAYYRRRPHLPSEQRAVVRRYADGLYQFIVKTYLDPSDGEFYFLADKDGTVKNRTKHLYANSFAIYGLSEYALAFGSESAKTTALRCFQAIDRRTHDDKNGGYDESQTSKWLWSGAKKDTNTHIHLLESFTQLFRITADPMVRARTIELLDIIQQKLVQPSGNTHAEFTEDYLPFGPATISYGHDIETAWLLFESLDAIELADGTARRAKACALGENAAKWGFDEKAGGFFEEGPVGGAPNKTEKIWWVQAEAVAGLFRIYAYRPHAKLLDQLERTLAFSERYLRDPNEGEWYWGVLPNGQLGTHRDVKSEEWKSSYHLVRAMLFTSDWIAEYLKTIPAR